jgi:hypothetical protein
MSGSKVLPSHGIEHSSSDLILLGVDQQLGEPAVTRASVR